MPELPDLVHVAAEVRRAVGGRAIVDAQFGDPVVLRLMIPAAFPEVLRGRRLLDVERRGHFLRFALDEELLLVVNAMLAGRYLLFDKKPARLPKATILALSFAGGAELAYTDEMRMGKIYVARLAQEGEIPGYRDLGVDLLSPAFTRERFRELIRGRRDQVRQFLLDKTALASIGNAYADEILFAARIHPKTFCHQLGPEQVDVLFGAIGRTLADAIAEISRRGEPIDVKVRDFLAVRGRDGKPCPVCGTTLRAVRVGAADACFCPTCQPTDRKLFVDFRKLPAGKPRDEADRVRTDESPAGAAPTGRCSVPRGGRRAIKKPPSGSYD
jgi:formamidopyrimidine-DNA glycosylase